MEMEEQSYKLFHMMSRCCHEQSRKNSDYESLKFTQSIKYRRFSGRLPTFLTLINQLFKENAASLLKKFFV